MSRARDDRRGTYTCLREKAAMALWPLKWRTRFQPIRGCFPPRSRRCLHRSGNEPLRHAAAVADRGTITFAYLANVQVHLLRAGQEAAVHARLAGQRRASIHREYLLGIAGTEPRPTSSRLNTVCDAAERMDLPATGLAFIVRRVGRSGNRGDDHRPGIEPQSLETAPGSSCALPANNETTAIERDSKLAW